jgi:hypothetical protein
MATFKYIGEDERVFPTLAITVKSGDTFDAPNDFVALNVTSVAAKTSTVAPTVETPTTASTVGE